MEPSTSSAPAAHETSERNAAARGSFDVLLNAGSGASEKEEIRARVAEGLERRGGSARVTLLRGDELVAAARDAVRAGRVPVAASGDGTMAAVAAAVAGTDVPMGILPLGTFNYFARSLGVPLELDEALDALCSGTVRRVAFGEVNGRLFLNNASVGIYPKVLDERESTFERYGRSRLVAYAVTLRLVLRR